MPKYRTIVEHCVSCHTVLDDGEESLDYDALCDVCDDQMCATCYRVHDGLCLDCKETP